MAGRSSGSLFFMLIPPAKFSARAVQLGYLIIALVVTSTLLAPLKQVVDNLYYYQGVLGIFSFYTMWLVVNSMMIKSFRSTLMIVSFFVLFGGVVNDFFPRCRAPIICMLLNIRCF
jgi:hypothetical protein